MKKLLVFCALFLVLEAVSSQTVNVQFQYTSLENKSVIFVIKKPLTLTCNVTVEGTLAAGDVIAVNWKKDGKLIEPSGRIKASQDGITYNLKLSDAENNDVGNWSCHAMVGTEERASADAHVVTTIAVRIKQDNLNVVEEERLRIECSVLGNPYPDLTWRINTTNYTGDAANYDRARIEDHTDDSGKLVENGVLIIDKVNKDDRGHFYCIGTNKYWDQNREESGTMIRVKDKYAALWPFLGICIEVVFLCALIIIYEKKRNKTELEESDTDQSPDQKNTPDHGKEANLRHRQ